MNITSLAMSLLTPAVVGRIATALGVNPAIAQMAINAALPAIMAAIAGKAATSSGLGVLTGLLGQQSPGMLGHFGELIGGKNQTAVVNAGASALNTLVGGETAGALAAAIGKFTGMPAQASTGILGMLSPVALGTVAQQQQAGGLDAAGLAGLLAGQAKNIAAALPAGFADVLKGTGLLEGLAPAPAAAAPSAPTAVKPMEKGAGQAAEAVTTALTSAAAAAMGGSASGVFGTAAKSAANVAAPSAVKPPTVAAAAAPAAPAVVAPAVRAAEPVVKSASAATPATTPSATPSSARVDIRPADIDTGGGSVWRWLLPLAVVLVLGWLGWRYWG